jgi:hypothetical protein
VLGEDIHRVVERIDQERRAGQSRPWPVERQIHSALADPYRAKLEAILIRLPQP